MKKKIVVKQSELMGYPPFPFLYWTEYAFKKLLKQKGMRFDLKGIWWREEDFKTGDLIFRYSRT